MDKVLKVVGVSVVDASPMMVSPPELPACAMPRGGPLVTAPTNEAELRTFVAEAIEVCADAFGLDDPGIHYVPDRASDSQPTSRSLIVRFGSHDFEVRVTRSEASNEGI